MESRVRYAEGAPAKIVAISTALRDWHPVVAVGTDGAVTRHTRTGAYSEQQEATRPWDLVLDEGSVTDIKLQKQVGHLQDFLRSERKYWAAKKEELDRSVNVYRGKFAEAVNENTNLKNHAAFLKVEDTKLKAQMEKLREERDEYREKFAVASNDLRSEKNHSAFLKVENTELKTQTPTANGMIAHLREVNQIMRTALTHGVAEDRGKFAEMVNDITNLKNHATFDKDTIEQLRKELGAVKEANTSIASEVVALEKQLSEADTRSKNQSAFLKLENTELKAQIMQIVKELDEALERRIAPDALIKELRQNLFDQEEREDFQVRSENTLLEEKLASFAPNPDEPRCPIPENIHSI